MAKKSPSPTFEPIKPTRAHEAVLAQLQRKILEGELAPGDRLPSEREMMDTFGVSRPTVYETIRRWEAEGEVGLLDRSRAPHSSPRQTKAEVTAALLTLKERHPTYGPDKLVRMLRDDYDRLTALLRRLSPDSASPPGPRTADFAG